MEISARILNENQDSRLKKCSTKSGDNISELPEEILSFIISFLTLKDAVRTRVLSRRWRYLSASTSNLHFDAFTLLGVEDVEAFVWSPSSRSRFVTAVDQFLQLWRGPKLYSFKVCCHLWNAYASHIDRWISVAVEMQTEKIELDFSHEKWENNQYDFPCHLLPRSEVCWLKHLCLNTCMLRPTPDFALIFNSLKTLDLINVSLDQDCLDSIFSGCANLDQLRLTRCQLPESIHMSGKSRSMKLVAVNMCYGLYNIKLSSIILNTFECWDSMLHLSFYGHPLFIENAILNMGAGGVSFLCNRLAKELPQLPNLSFYLHTAQMPPITENVTKFQHLKDLEMFFLLTSDFDLFSVVLALNAAPCLEKFLLALRYDGYEGPMVEREYSKQLYYHLKEIEMYGCIDKCNALALAKHLLKSAVGLQRMLIDCNKHWSFYPHEKWESAPGRYRPPSPVQESEKKRFMEGLLEERRDDVELIVM